jgi:hypothetical protein
MLALELKSILDTSAIFKEKLDPANEDLVKKIRILVGRYRVMVEGIDEGGKEDQGIRARLLKNRLFFANEELMDRANLSNEKLRFNLIKLKSLLALLEKDPKKKLKLLAEVSSAYDHFVKKAKDPELLAAAKLRLFEVNITSAQTLLKSGKPQDAIKILRSIDRSLFEQVKKMPQKQKAKIYSILYRDGVPSLLLAIAHQQQDQHGCLKASLLAAEIISQLQKQQIKDLGKDKNRELFQVVVSGAFYGRNERDRQIDKKYSDDDYLMLM